MTTLRITLAMALLSAAGCFPHPSEQYACNTTEECEGGRTCEQNFCVLRTSDDAGSDADTVCPTFMARHFDACMIPKPGEALALTAAEYRYDTTTGTLFDPSNSESMPVSVVVGDRRVLSIASFTLPAGGTLRVIGMYPLVIASWDTITVQGTIDAASKALLVGPGANPAACMAHRATPGTQGANGGAGGGGGSMQSAGGTGGNGSNGAVTGGPGGIALATNMPLLEGGCPGETGGLGGGGALAGAGGPGGGAVQLTARTSITIAATGKLSAGGGGGGTGPASNVGGGGGGGGSGGMIGLEAPVITIEAGAVLAANGGGGGQGAGATVGQPGQDAQVAAAPAAGGTGAGTGGPGGAGSISTTIGGNGTLDGAGGGGGGGGAGYVAIKAGTLQNAGSTISPAATVVP